MAGTINSLGIGSGVLTADVIDKLKKNEKDVIVKPIENKIELQKQKSQSLDLLKSLLTSFRANAKALDDDALYQSRTVDGSNDGVSVSAQDGVAVQSFRISDTRLALKNVFQSGHFDSRNATVAQGDGTMSITIDSQTFDIDYTATTTLDELKTKINDVAGEKVEAKILQVGDNDYTMVLTSKETGESQNITVSDSAVGSLDAGLYRTRDSIEGGAFSAASDTVASGSGSMTLTVNGTDYTINYDTSTTLQSLVDDINNTVGSDVASIHQSASGEYRLVVESTSQWEDDTLKIVDNGGALDSKITSYTQNDFNDEIQKASDAKFKYNGIEITRSSNTIDDLIVGVTIELKQENASSNISIKQDVSAVSEEMQSFVDNYNSLMSQIDKMTLADTEENKVGLFNGDNSIRGIGREITKIITSFSNDGFSLSQFGINISQDGVMSFNSAQFEKKFNEDPKAAELFLSGGSTVNESGNVVTHDGVFTKLADTMDNLTATNGTINTIITGNEKEGKNLEESHKRALALLNSRYDTMTARFIEYDAIISKLNNQFSVLQQQIEMAINGKD